MERLTAQVSNSTRFYETCENVPSFVHFSDPLDCQIKLNLGWCGQENDEDPENDKQDGGGETIGGEDDWCCDWAIDGQCERSVWMKLNCPTACGTSHCTG